MLPDGVISSRKGNAPLYDDVRDAVLARAREIIDEKNPELAGELKGRRRARCRPRLAEIRDAGARQQQASSSSISKRRSPSRGTPRRTFSMRTLAPAAFSRMRRRAAGAASLDFGELRPEELDLLQQIAAFPDEMQRAADGVPAAADRLVRLRAGQALQRLLSRLPGAADRRSRCARPGWRWSPPRGTLANGLALLGIEAPSAM